MFWPVSADMLAAPLPPAPIAATLTRAPAPGFTGFCATAGSDEHAATAAAPPSKARRDQPCDPVFRLSIIDSPMLRFLEAACVSANAGRARRTACPMIVTAQMGALTRGLQFPFGLSCIHRSERCLQGVG